MVNQVAFQVIGADLTITHGGRVLVNYNSTWMEPVIALQRCMQSMTLLTNAVNVLRDRCVAGLTPIRIGAGEHLQASAAVRDGADTADWIRAGGRPCQGGS